MQMSKANDKKDQVKPDPDRALVVDAKTYGFWLNEEDDVYDELYRKKETDSGGCVSS